MAKFIKIFHRTEAVETDLEVRPIGVMNKIVLQQVVGCYLTNEQFEDLADYFEDNVFMKRVVELHKTCSFDIRNKDEILENAPLPDGTVINATSFEDNGRYLVIMGNDNKDNTETKVGILL